MTFVVEAIFRVYDNDTGEYIQVAENPDMPEIIDITISEDKNTRITMHAAQAIKLIEALNKFLEHKALNR